MHQVLKKVLLLSKGVSDKLQSEGLDVVSGERVTDLLTAVKALRCDVKFEDSGLQLWKNVQSWESRSQKKSVLVSFLGDLMRTPIQPNTGTVKDNFKVFFYYNVSFQTIH